MSNYSGLILAIKNPGNQCILWQHQIDAYGYGVVKYKGKSWKAHRLALSLYTGQQPSLLAAHNCRNRHCFNPKHLEWKTNKQNSMDMYRDGTVRTGEKGTAHKLTESQIPMIRKDPRSLKVIAKDYGVSHTAIAKVKNKQTWAYL